VEALNAAGFECGGGFGEVGHQENDKDGKGGGGASRLKTE
jgi:hypothetical protein